MPSTTILHGSHNHFIAGGSDRYFFELGHLLETRGHHVIPFCAADQRNEPSEYADYFPPAPNPDRPTPANALRFIYSRPARHKITQLIAARQPDIAHLHIYYGKLTASILAPLRNAGIPIIQTLHEYKLLCPVYNCIRNSEVCEDCGGKQFWKATVHRCNRGSLLRSLASSAESYTSKILGSHDGIDHYIGVSQFMTDKMRSIGIPDGKLSTVHNFVDTSRHEAAQGKGGYLLYFGRLEATKGLFTLLDALQETPHLRCIIAGSGPALHELRARAGHLCLNNVEFPGFISGTALQDLVRGAICTILPSEWYENCPMSVLESLALGRPVIGTRIGGIPELINNEEDGLIVEAGNARQLAGAMRALGDDPARAAAMGVAGREKVQREFSADVHYAKIRAVYDRVLG